MIGGLSESVLLWIRGGQGNCFGRAGSPVLPESSTHGDPLGSNLLPYQNGTRRLPGFVCFGARTSPRRIAVAIQGAKDAVMIIG